MTILLNMSTVELKKLLVKRIQASDDPEFLNALRILTERKVQSLNNSVKKKLQKSLKDLNAGNVQDSEEVFDELDRWLAKK